MRKIKKLKKIISMLLLCSIILVQTVYAIENISENQSTNKDNINKNGYFAEKNHIIYYMKYVKIEENHEALQLYQYDLQTQIASPLCKDYFQYDPIAPIYNMRVCNDGYVYFKAQRKEIKEEEQKSGYYRVSVNGGKSEYVCKYEEIAFLSDSWVYWAEKNVFYNLVTNEVIENTVTSPFDAVSITQYWNSTCEYQDTIYIQARHWTAKDVDGTSDEIKYKNGQALEYGVYALPLHEQNAFHKIELEYKINYFQIYNNNLYYLNENTIKQYSLQNHTTKTIVKVESGNIYQFAVYNNTLYYCYSIEKNGKYYHNLYSVSLNEEQSQAIIAVPYLFGNQIHILEDVICYAHVDKWSIGNWRIFDIHTGKRYFIEL